MADKADRLKARVPRGFVDRAADDIRATEKMIETIRGVYERYGFDPVETPMFEYTDALGKFLPDQDRPNEGVFSLQDDDEQWMSLRYDLTAPLARYVAENYETLPKPYRSYRAGWVFRNEKPGPGRFRQFMQFDADTVGTPGVAADAEMAMMMADVMEALGIARGDYVIRVNNRKVLDGIKAAAGIPEEKWLTVLRAIDKLDRLRVNGVAELMGTGRTDESGDRTEGANLDTETIELSLKYSAIAVREGNEWMEQPVRGSLADGHTNIEFIDAWESQFPADKRPAEAFDELRTIASLCERAGYGRERIKIDESVVRGLEYYTGPVYEAELLFKVPNEKGEIVRFGSVGGGGRYDGLVKRFTGQDVPATGFSIGVSRLMTALKNLGKLDASDLIGPVVVLVMDKDTESLGRYQKMVTDLRNEGVRAEMYLGGSGMKAQMKYADRRGAPCVVIQGSNERAAGTLEIKDLIEGKRLSAEIEDNATWRESRPAQVTVKEADLVAEVKKIIAAQMAERARGR